MNQPLASILRPQKLDELVGQKSIVSQMKSYIESGKIPSMVFRGPPGSGKTTLAIVISHELDADFMHLSGVSSKKSDLSDIIHQAQMNKGYNKRTIVFLDEIHRRNKAQQDALLPYVEDGTIILIGATTENPSFTINNALLSRAKVIVFDKHSEDDIIKFIESHMSEVEKIYPGIEVPIESVELIGRLANGDLRNALNLLEGGLMVQQSGTLNAEAILTAYGKPVYYDRNGEEHYNIISAVHKSLRDSDADAACYRIMRMLQGGEDPLYICRRLIRFASEDIGPADNNALLLATTVYDVCAKLGMPECDNAIMQLAIYLAKAKKNNICYVVSHEAKSDVERFGNLPVPIHLRNAPSKLMKNLGYGKGYKYAHDYENAQVDQEHFPDELKGRKYIK